MILSAVLKDIYLQKFSAVGIRTPPVVVGHIAPPTDRLTVNPTLTVYTHKMRVDF